MWLSGLRTQMLELHALGMLFLLWIPFTTVVQRANFSVWDTYDSRVSERDLRTTGECQFPKKWDGLWFQSGISQPVRIKGDFMSTKGRCISQEGDKYLLEEKNDHCYRCIVIHQRHENALQYKETFCDSPDTLEKICSQINGDALLHSMFRVDGKPVGCPFRGAYSFSYNKGPGECKFPMSTMEQCSEDYRILLRYQACPDIVASESYVEELTCLAMWREGSLRFLVGKLDHKLASTDEDKYRCFAFERRPEINGYFVAQSGDATCNGLLTATDGSRTMRLYKVSFPSPHCHFPSWFAHRWHSLDGRWAFSFGHRNHSLKIVDHAGSLSDTHLLCLKEVAHSPDRQMIIFSAHFTFGCTSGFRCYTFTRRGDNVVEVQSGRDASSKDPCDHRYFDRLSAAFTTLVTATPELSSCPYSGQYTVPGVLVRTNQDDCDAYFTVKIGCDSSDTIELRYECTAQVHLKAFHCHGKWEENGTNYLITSLKGTNNKYCFIYNESENIVKFSSVRDSCPRDIQLGREGFMAFNFTANPAEQCSLSDMERTAMTGDSTTRRLDINCLLSVMYVIILALSR